MFSYRILNPIDELYYQLFSWKKGHLIEIDPKKMKSLGLRKGDVISSSQMAAIAKTPMAVI